MGIGGGSGPQFDFRPFGLDPHSSSFEERLVACLNTVFGQSHRMNAKHWYEHMRQAYARGERNAEVFHVSEEAVQATAALLASEVLSAIRRWEDIPYDILDFVSHLNETETITYRPRTEDDLGDPVIQQREASRFLNKYGIDPLRVFCLLRVLPSHPEEVSTRIELTIVTRTWYEQAERRAAARSTGGF